MSQDDKDAKRIQELLLEAGFGPSLDTANLLLFLAAGIYVMEKHKSCAAGVLDVHLAGWAKSFREEKKPS